MTTSTKDTLYAAEIDTIKPFEFDERVADVFPNMIQRSVPGYALTISMLGVIASQYARANTQLYDLGCSLGAGTLAMRHSVTAQDCRIVAVDNSPAMIERCQKIIQRDNSDVSVQLLCRDINEVTIVDASVVALNFTLQFIKQELRRSLLEKIYHGLLPGGVLVLSEKISFETDAEQQVMEGLHHQFKRLNGYNDLEVANKRTALENVLVPETVVEHQDRLKAVGFESATIWMRCLNFVSILASK